MKTERNCPWEGGVENIQGRGGRREREGHQMGGREVAGREESPCCPSRRVFGWRSPLCTLSGADLSASGLSSSEGVSWSVALLQGGLGIAQSRLGRLVKEGGVCVCVRVCVHATETELIPHPLLD